MDNIFLKVVKHPEKIEYYLLKHKIGEIVPDKIYLSRMYKNHIQIGVWT